jgi:hypothetical protein
VDLQLNTVCNRTVNDVCDATGGFSFTQNTIDNFGKINLRRGHRVIEIAVKYRHKSLAYIRHGNMMAPCPSRCRPSASRR